MIRDEKQTMPAELAKALLEDGEKEAKESFEGVPSLVVAATEATDDDESQLVNVSLQPANASVQAIGSSQPSETTPSSQPEATLSPPTNQPQLEPEQPQTDQPDINPSPSSSNSDLFF